MKRIGFFLLSLTLTLFVFTCSLYPPDYVGEWRDTESLYGWTYTLSFQRSRFSISMETYDAILEETIVYTTSGVMKAGAGVMDATITGQIIDETELGDSELQAFVAYLGGADYKAQYTVTGNTISLSGDLVEKICSPLTDLQATWVLPMGPE